jgi:hypothetical protein
MKAQTLFRIASIAVMILGCIHVCATPVIFNLFNGHGNFDLVSVYMFVIVGITTFFLGWVQLFTLKRIKDNEGFQIILKATIAFLCIIGIGAVAAMRDNPFAYISLSIALFEAISHKHFSTTQSS